MSTDAPNALGATPVAWVAVTLDANTQSGPYVGPIHLPDGRGNDGTLEHSIFYSRGRQATAPHIGVCDHNVGTNYSLEQAKELKRALDEAIVEWERDIARPPPPEPVEPGPVLPSDPKTYYIPAFGPPPVVPK